MNKEKNLNREFRLWILGGVPVMLGFGLWVVVLVNVVFDYSVAKMVGNWQFWLWVSVALGLFGYGLTGLVCGGIEKINWKQRRSLRWGGLLLVQMVLVWLVVWYFRNFLAIGFS